MTVFHCAPRKNRGCLGGCSRLVRPHPRRRQRGAGEPATDARSAGPRRAAAQGTAPAGPATGRPTACRGADPPGRVMTHPSIQLCGAWDGGMGRGRTGRGWDSSPSRCVPQRDLEQTKPLLFPRTQQKTKNPHFFLRIPHSTLGVGAMGRTPTRHKEIGQKNGPHFGKMGKRDFGTLGEKRFWASLDHPWTHPPEPSKNASFGFGMFGPV